MTNETREALVLLKAQLAACEEAALRFAALKDTLCRSASGGGLAEVIPDAERSLSEVRTLGRKQAAFLETAQSGALSEVIAREPNLTERLAVERVLRSVTARQQELREDLQRCAELLNTSAAFVNYQLNVISGTVADDTYGKSQPVAGPNAGIRREIAMFDADV
ncbi:hypothetical protein HMPREF1992_01761 [Selenomonas sp. oral taxon 892 str. F0426]|jgi:hypothetical protein|uniref:hypothetical protein n=1 Tax=Selenomonas sp. oral taxon 892 TaxID=1321785 RepID=UPI0003AD1AC8|nr:hypothetical protein [Selenomonas sp. oral taxon 892]ERJ90497.1 hypothetical protein HMPREF1992_01761 [Selenomonas sp. oral taxon 892 str. F0426]